MISLAMIRDATKPLINTGGQLGKWEGGQLFFDDDHDPYPILPRATNDVSKLALDLVTNRGPFVDFLAYNNPRGEARDDWQII